MDSATQQLMQLRRDTLRAEWERVINELRVAAHNMTPRSPDGSPNESDLRVRHLLERRDELDEEIRDVEREIRRAMR